MTAFPTTPEAVTADWLSGVLDAPVDSVRVEVFGEGTGVIAQNCRLHIDSPAAVPATLFAKFASASETNRGVALQYDMYTREVRFYRDLAGGFPVRVPRCHFADIAAPDEFVILLEDLGGLQPGDQVAGASVDVSREIVDLIAAMHGGYAGAANLPEWVPSHNNPTQSAGMAGGFEFGWPVVLETFGDFVPQRIRDVAATMPNHVQALLDELCAEPQTLVHADVRLDNLLFEPGAPTVLIDWQSVCTGGGEQDLAYFLTQSLAPELLAAEEDDLIARYVDGLATAGVDASIGTVRGRYVTAALYLSCYAVVIAGTLDLANERGKALGKVLVERCFAALDRLDAFDRLG